jgi:hypothetical protein
MSWQRALVGADRPFAPRVAARSGYACKKVDVPTIGPQGHLTYRDHTAYLSERDALLASVLVFYFEVELTDAELLDRVWPDGATRHTLRRGLRRLNRRLGRVGLEITDIGGHTHALRPVDGR